MLVFAGALVIGQQLFPLGSPNRDEPVYLAFADMLRDGRLTLSASEHWPFRPWASGRVDGRIVLKYAPPWPAVLAVFDAAVGYARAASALAAAAATVLVGLLARQVVDRTSTAVLAAAFFGLTPMVLIQGGTALSYVFQVALGVGTVIVLVAGARRSSLRLLALAGFLFGLCAFARAFDAVIFVGPFAAFTLLWHWRRIVAFGVGALPSLGAFLAYNALIVGGIHLLPFTVTGDKDGFGFGERGVFPDSTVPFTFLNGLEGTVTNLAWLVPWSFGGPILLALAVLGVRRARPSEVKRGLLLMAGAYSLAYVFFWGSYAIVHHWRGAASLGPFYHLPLLVPLAIFGAIGLGDVIERVRRPPRAVTAVTLVVMAVMTLAWIPPKIAASETIRRRFARAEAVADDMPSPGLLFLTDQGVFGFDSWTPFLFNDPDLDQPVLYPEDRAAENFAVIDRFPGRHYARLVALPDNTVPRRFKLVTLEVQTAASLDVTLQIQPPLGTRAQAYVVDGRREVLRPVEPLTRWTITPRPDPAPSGLAEPGRFTVGFASGTLAFGMDLVTVDTGAVERWEIRIPYRVVDDRIELLRPGRGFRMAGGLWIDADTSSLLREAPGG